MKIPRCCKNCPNRYHGMCNCVAPMYSDWVDDYESTPVVYNPILIEEDIKDKRIKELENQINIKDRRIKKLEDQIKGLIKWYGMSVEAFTLA